MNLKRLIPAVVFIFMLNLVYATAPPPFMLFSGTAKMNNIDVPIGTVIEAFIVDDSDPSVNDGSALVNTTPGNYDLAVTGTTSDINKIIIFYIDGEKANENATFSNMDTQELDLSIDYCIENWNCTEWTSCSGGTQTRTCTDVSNCGTENDKPSTSQSCDSGGGGSSGGGGGGGGSSCKPNYVCEPISPCSSQGKQTEVCTDIECNKGPYRRTVSCDYVAPQQRESTREEGIEEVEKKVEETPVALEPAETTPETLTSGSGITGAAIGVTYQQRPLAMGMLTVFIVLIIGLFIYSHAKNIKNWPFHFKFEKKRWVVLVIIILVIFISLFIYFVLLNYFRSAS